jgi:hypothetical protein
MVPCLDYGFVELISAAPDGKQLVKIVDTMRRGKTTPQILKMPMVYFKFKAPIFVVVAMGNFKKLQDNSYDPEYYYPKIDDIRAPDLETSEDIAESIKMTIDAGLVNQETYVVDGCNPFVATLTTTVSTYWQGVIYGDLLTWIEFAREKHAPAQIKTYQRAVEDILVAEFPALDDYLRRSR